MPTEGKSRRVRRRKELHVSNRLYDLLLLTTYQSRHPVRTIVLPALIKRGKLAESATDRQRSGAQNGRFAEATSSSTTAFL